MEVSTKHIASSLKNNPWATIVLIMVVGGFYMGYIIVNEIAFSLIELNKTVVAMQENQESMQEVQNEDRRQMTARAERWISVLDRMDRRLQADCLNRAEDGLEESRCTSVNGSSD